MDSLDAAHKLSKEFGVDFEEVRKAVDLEADEIRSTNEGARIRYPKAIDMAVERVAMWIRTAEEYRVTLDWADLAKFAASHRASCVWAVLAGKARLNPFLHG